ncbi:MAG: hypothetical protein H0U73_03145 [Tatlockia sp.]|nr:hypothetical protein [Tatlockia sp.]
MQTKQEITAITLTLADWQLACKEIRNYATEHYEAISKIEPTIRKEAESPENTLIKFTENQEIDINIIADKLGLEIQNNCVIFIQICKTFYLEMNLLKRPPEIASHIWGYADRKSLSALACTSSFFNTDPFFVEIKNSKKRFRQILPQGWGILALTDDRKLLGCGLNTFGPGRDDIMDSGNQLNSIQTAIKNLVTGEVIEQVSTGLYASLCLQTQAGFLAVWA